jgi:CheY-like chemotaxis protein
MNSAAKKTIRMTEERVAAIMDQLDEADQTSAGGNTGFAYRHPRMTLHMRQPGSASPVAFLVFTRRLTERSLSFLHGGYLHELTLCTGQLTTLHGSWERISGTVKSCRYIEANLHEVELTLEKQIDPSLFCSNASRCRVLLVDDDPALARLATYQLNGLNADVVHVDNGQRAVDTALAGTFDLILMDLQMPVMGGVEATQALRRAGYGGVIASFTARADLTESEKSGFDRHITKPFTSDDLSHLLESLREEPLYSTFHDVEAMAGLINDFVDELPARVRAIEQAASDQDTDGLLSVAKALKDCGGSYGFDPITDAATAVTSRLSEGATVANVGSEVVRLVNYCRLARGRN